MGRRCEPQPLPTDTAADSAKPGAVEPVAASLGRYRFVRELGCGAMGVVHAAFDPDLERLIAVKVLRNAAAPREAKDRLLREARAMARLTHPNVVSVYEVGTSGGRDFVAMELIDGETLATWLRARHPSVADIVDAFIAAGRGLAAAHAAGIVHRDFKPCNVLRHRDGRIAVTDFGLARDAQERGDSSRADLGAHGPRAAFGGATLTASGAVLGTPPYMALEQWSGGAITSATDQFAYCVALWEALAGELPFRGQSREELRAQIARGPSDLDASRIPPRFRRLLRRGLLPDPTLRWPSMDAVISRLERARRRPGVALAVAGAVMAVAATAMVMRASDAAAPAVAACGLGRDLPAVWSPTIAASVGKRLSATDVDALDAAFHSWVTARDRACSAAPRVSAEQLPCLEGVLDRFELLRKASVRVPDDAVEAILAQLVDPAVCLKPAPLKAPQFTLAATPQLISAYMLLARAETTDKPSDAELTAQIAASAEDPCTRVVSTLAFSAASSDARQAHSLMIGAAAAAEQCGDMRLSTDLKIQDIQYHWEWPVGGRDADDGIAQAQGAAARVMQPELRAALAAERRKLARQRGQWDEAFAQSELEIEAYRERGLQRRWLQAVIARNDLRLARSQPLDLDAVVAEATYARAIALGAGVAALAAELDRQAAEARFWLGDPAAGAAWSRLWRAQQRTTTRSRRTIRGIVVDEHGAPVAGANVAAANLLRAASLDIGSPLSDNAGALRVTTTDAAGRFAIDAPPHTGAIVAQRGDQRSRSAAIIDGVRLVLQPTRRVTGRVVLGDTPYTQVSVRCVDADDRGGRFRIVAPLHPDGSFVIDGATTGALRVGIATRDDLGSGGQVELQAFPASRRAITDVELAVPGSTRTLDVAIRSAVATRLEGAQVVVVPGRHRFRNFGDVIRAPLARRLEQFASPELGPGGAPLAARSRVRDFSAHLEHVPAGALTVCALGFSDDVIYPQVRTTLQDHVTELTLECKHVGPDVHDVVIAVPPQRRFES